MNIADRMNLLVQDIDKAIAALHIDNLFAVVDISDVNAYDPCVKLMINGTDKPYDSGYFITPVLEEVRSFSSTHCEIMFYYVQTIVYDHGFCRDEPPFTELVDLHKTRSHSDAIINLLKAYVQNTVNGMFEAMDEFKMSKDLEEVYD